MIQASRSPSKGIFNGRYFDVNIINKIGVRGELIETIRRIRWEKLFIMHLDVYEDLVYEFYSSLSMHINNHKKIIEYIMSFRIKCDDYNVTSETFVE